MNQTFGFFAYKVDQVGDQKIAVRARRRLKPSLNLSACENNICQVLFLLLLRSLSVSMEMCIALLLPTTLDKTKI